MEREQMKPEFRAALQMGQEGFQQEGFQQEVGEWPKLEERTRLEACQEQEERRFSEDWSRTQSR